MKSSKKLRVWKRDNYICFYCSKLCTPEEVTVDHVIPRQGGGTNDMDNLTTACKPCNQAKGRREGWRKYHHKGVDNKVIK